MSEWREITCEEREELFARLDGGTARNLAVLASSTDPERYIFTEWGDRTSEAPVLRDHRFPDGSRPCKHEVPAAITRRDS
jgi:hypothetical protein